MTEEIISESLKKTAKGVTIAFFGMIIFMFLEFITRAIIARNTTQTDYGVFNIGFVLLNFFVIVACLGLNTGVPRYIAYFKGTGDNKKIAGIISSSIQLSLIAGIFLFLFFFFSADFFTEFFHLQPSPVLKIFAIAIPFSVIIEIVASIFIGFGRIEVKVYFRDAFASVLKVISIISAIILGYTFIQMIYAYTISIVVAAIFFTIYAIKKLSIVSGTDKYPMRKEIILFSLPLLTTNILNIIILQLDTLILGYFKTADIVGLYNAARPITQFLNIFLVSLSFVYIPIASQLYSKNHVEEIRKNYIILTKWIFSATLPLFIIIFLFPEAVINILFGTVYAQADVALTLRILALGMLINVVFGPNAPTLIVIGKPKLVFIDNFIASIIYISINLYLIPTHGMIGAAIASAISLGAINILKSMQIFYFHKIHPFSSNYLKTVIISCASVFLIYVIANNFFSNIITIWVLIALSLLFLVIYGLSILITKSYDEEEIYYLKSILKRI